MTVLAVDATAGRKELNAYEIVGGYIVRFGWARSVHDDDLDDLWGRLLLTCVSALATWQPDAGRNRISWCWLHLHRDAGRWWKKHCQWRDMLHVDDTGAWMTGGCTEDGYAQVEARCDLQVIADRANLTPQQANAVEWWAVHGGTQTHHLGGHRPWFPDYTNSLRQGCSRGIARMRRAAIR